MKHNSASPLNAGLWCLERVLFTPVANLVLSQTASTGSEGIRLASIECETQKVGLITLQGFSPLWTLSQIDK